MKTGFAALSIVPKQDTILAGYAPYRKMSGVHDEIYVRALILDAPQRIVLIQFDLLVIEAVLKKAIAQRLDAHGYDEAHLLVSATHTHSSIGHIMDSNREPLVERSCGLLSMEVIECLAKQAEQAVLAAEQQLCETSIRMKESVYQGLGSNRTDAHLPGDQQLAMIELIQDNGTKLLVYNLSCHSTVMDQNNTLISADFSGAVHECMKQDYAMVMFLNGSCGDMSTRFNRKESSFAECKRLAEGVAKAIQTELSTGDGETLNDVSMRNFSVTLPVRKPLSAEKAKQNLDHAQQELDAKIAAQAPQGEIRLAKEKHTGAYFQYLEATQPNMAANIGDTISVPCSLLTLQGKQILFIPLELYSKLSLQIKETKPIWIVGYTNHHLGYMPDQAAYEKHDYESALTIFAKGAGEQFVQEVKKELNAE